MVEAAHDHYLADDGTVWAWGDNGNYQLGDGTQTDRSTPAQVTGLPEIVDIAVGWHHVIALDAGGRVWFWGHRCPKSDLLFLSPGQTVRPRGRAERQLGPPLPELNFFETCLSIAGSATKSA